MNFIFYTFLGRIILQTGLTFVSLKKYLSLSMVETVWLLRYQHSRKMWQKKEIHTFITLLHFYFFNFEVISQSTIFSGLKMSTSQTRQLSVIKTSVIWKGLHSSLIACLQLSRPLKICDFQQRLPVTQHK